MKNIGSSIYLYVYLIVGKRYLLVCFYQAMDTVASII